MSLFAQGCTCPSGDFFYGSHIPLQLRTAVDLLKSSPDLSDKPISLQFLIHNSPVSGPDKHADGCIWHGTSFDGEHHFIPYDVSLRGEVT